MREPTGATDAAWADTRAATGAQLEGRQAQQQALDLRLTLAALLIEGPPSRARAVSAQGTYAAALDRVQHLWNQTAESALDGRRGAGAVCGVEHRRSSALLEEDSRAGAAACVEVSDLARQAPNAALHPDALTRWLVKDVGSDAVGSELGWTPASAYGKVRDLTGKAVKAADWGELALAVRLVEDIERLTCSPGS